ncbi:MAG: nickel insertion protein, partial [Candidatus Saliniplasma sp.]
MTNIIYMDLENGISGDMLLGALLDLVENEYILDDMVEKLGLEDVDIVVTDKKELFSGKDVKVKYDDQPHRTLSEILDIIESSSLSN